MEVRAEEGGMGRRGGRRTGWALLALGVVLMVGASLWAPAQPEVLTSGACEVAPCGTLEDPARWQAAWLPWALGALACLLATTLRAAPGAPPRWPEVVLALLLLPVLGVALLVVAVVVSWSTSVHGAATVLVLGLVLPVGARVAETAKGLARRRDLRDSAVPSPLT
ncbi:hypothetical protein [Phycicoccus avicenniae]|uniref:hypothetical protein n=1 Tax=Phycicoccus avicenniae TaxID=2828860 RepID=UPI003D2C2472